MSNSPFLEHIASQLRHGGLPTDYVRRVLHELSDHCEDHRIANSSPRGDAGVSSAVGEPSLLAEQFITNFRARTFAGRHPLLAVLVIPFLLTPPIAILCQEPCVAMVVGLQECGDYLASSTVKWLILTIVVAHRLSAIVPFIITMTLAARAAIQSGRGMRWLFLACGCHCLLGAAFMSQVTLPVGGVEPSLTLTFLPFHDWDDAIEWLPQFANASALAVLAFARWRHAFETTTLETTALELAESN